MRRNRLADSLRIHARLRKTVRRLSELSSNAAAIYQGENLLAYILSIKDSLSKALYSLVELSDNARVFNRVALETPVSDAFFTDVTSMINETDARLAAVRAVHACSEDICLHCLTQGTCVNLAHITGTDIVPRGTRPTFIGGRSFASPPSNDIHMALYIRAIEPHSDTVLRMVQGSACHIPYPHDRRSGYR